MIDVPHWVQVFVLVGIALVVIVVPIRILYEMTKDSRDRNRRFQDLADRLREKFGGVEAHRTIFGMSRIEFKHEGRPATVYQPADDEIMIQLEPRIEPKFHVIARTLGPLSPGFAVMWESFRILPRIMTFDPLIDDSIAIYATPIIGGYLREAAIDGILVVDSAGRMVSFNRRFVRMWGIPPDVVAARSDEAAIASVLHNLVAPEKFISRVRYLYAHPEEESRDELALKDGRTFDRYSAAVRSADGVMHGRVWYFRDMTEQKRQQEAMREGTARLQETLHELNTFAYTVAHDLRAPLRAMVGFSQVLQEDYAPALDSLAHDYIRRIAEAARRMDKLIQDLLTYSRLTRDLMPIENVELAPLVAEVLGRFEAEFRETGARVDVNGPLPPVRAHRVALHQVISNLLSNAVKFVAPGTRPEVRIYSQRKRGRVRLWVEDNGIGIAGEYQDRIFGVFQRLHSLAEYPGTGIGLAIVKRAVERMGGRVGVESATGKGSRFWIEFRSAR